MSVIAVQHRDPRDPADLAAARSEVEARLTDLVPVLAALVRYCHPGATLDARLQTLAPVPGSALVVADVRVAVSTPGRRDEGLVSDTAVAVPLDWPRTLADALGAKVGHWATRTADRHRRPSGQ